MGIGDIFKTGQFKNEIEELKQENARLQGELNHAQSLLTPERRCVLWEDERNTLNYRTATALLSAYPGRIGQTLMEFTLRPKNSI